MRARLIVQVSSLAVVVAVGAIWMKSRATAVDLQARLAALATLRCNTARALEQERDHLRAALAEANRRRQTDAVATTPAPPLPVPPPAVAPSLALGEWSSLRERRNEGQSTPRGTIATLLWAAAGGDVAAMTSLIAYDEAGRKQAQALFDTLPPAARQAFPTPEALVAGLTIKAVPDSAAQLTWFHQRDADHATVGLLLRTSEQSAPAEIRALPAEGNLPPTLDNPGAAQLTVLSLQLSAQGWQVIIPAAAIERLARQYQAPAS